MLVPDACSYNEEKNCNNEQSSLITEADFLIIRKKIMEITFMKC